MNLQVSEQNGVSIIALHGKIMGGPEAGEINDKINQLLNNHPSTSKHSLPQF